MEVKEYVGLELENLKRGINRVLKDLNQQELIWRPACGCNSIGLILFHLARMEDIFVQGRMQEKSEVWKMGNWYQKLNMAENDVGAHYTVEQVNAFTLPKLEDVLAYYDAVRAATKDYLQTMTSATFEKKITAPRFGEVTIAFLFALIIGHTSQHIGEISYLRGLQRGMDK